MRSAVLFEGRVGKPVLGFVLGVALVAPGWMSAQTGGAQGATGGTSVHHRATSRTTARARAAKAAACPAEAMPALPAGVPAVEGKVETAFRLRYVDSKVGDGELVTPSDYLTVQYTGWLAADGTKFDSSLDRNAPFTFPQGMHRVITGWDQGFGGMRVGGKRRLFIPYQLAYGEDGRPPIPPKSDLIFDIELVGASATPPGSPAQPPQ